MLAYAHAKQAFDTFFRSSPVGSIPIRSGGNEKQDVKAVFSKLSVNYIYIYVDFLKLCLSCLQRTDRGLIPWAPPSCRSGRALRGRSSPHSLHTRWSRAAVGEAASSSTTRLSWTMINVPPTFGRAFPINDTLFSEEKLALSNHGTQSLVHICASQTPTLNWETRRPGKPRDCKRVFFVGAKNVGALSRPPNGLVGTLHFFDPPNQLEYEATYQYRRKFSIYCCPHDRKLFLTLIFCIVGINGVTHAKLKQSKGRISSMMVSCWGDLEAGTHESF